MRLTGAKIIWECLVREGVESRLRLSGRHHSARLRCHARLSDPPRAGAARAGRHAHGRRVTRAPRASVGVAMCDLRPRRDQHSSPALPRRMMDSAPMVCITGQVASTAHRLRRLSRDRCHRHHAARDQAQLSRHAAVQDIASHHPRGVLHRAHGTARPGAGGHCQRCAAEDADRLGPCRRRAQQLPGYRPDLHAAARRHAAARVEMIHAAPSARSSWRDAACC